MSRLSTRARAGSPPKPLDPNFRDIERQVRQFKRWHNFAIDHEVEEEFKDTLKGYCLASHLADEAPQARDARAITSKLAKSAASLQTAIAPVFRREHIAIHAFLAGNRMPDLEVLSCQLAGVQAACHLALAEIAKQTKRGKEPNEAFAEWVVRGAIIFARHYGVPTTNWRRKGARDTPFVTIMRELSKCIPVNVVSESAIEERIHKALQRLKKQGKNRRS